MARVDFQALAESDLVEIYTYLARDSSEAARKVITTIQSKCESLAEFPGMGRERPELAPNLRSYVVWEYLVFYRASPEGIEVVRVLHGRRDIEEIFSPAESGWIGEQR